MIKNYPDKNSFKYMTYSELLVLKKSLTNKLIVRKRNLLKAIDNEKFIKQKYSNPQNVSENLYIVLAENKVVNIKSEIFILTELLNEVEKYLKPMLDKFSNAKQFGEE